MKVYYVRCHGTSAEYAVRAAKPVDAKWALATHLRLGGIGRIAASAKPQFGAANVVAIPSAVRS